MLLWKDKHCSRFVVDSAPDGSVSDKQVVTLSAHPSTDRSVRALEGEVLGTMPREFLASAAGAGLQEGQLIKFSISAVDHDADEPRVNDLAFLAKASPAVSAFCLQFSLCVIANAC